MKRVSAVLAILLLLVTASATFAQYQRQQRPQKLPLIYWSPEMTEKELMEKGVHSTYSKSAYVAVERHGGKSVEFINEFGDEAASALAVLSRKGGKLLLEMHDELEDVSRVSDLLALIAIHPKRERIIEVMWKFRASFAKTNVTEALIIDSSSVLRLGRKVTLDQIEKVYADSQKNAIELILNP